MSADKPDKPIAPGADWWLSCKAFWSFLKLQAKQLRLYTLTVYLLARDALTPITVRLLAALIAAYALSPIDLIPDFIPVIGYLDELILIPLGIALILRLTPAALVTTSRTKAQLLAMKPVSYTGAIVIIGIWLLVLFTLVRWAVASGVFSG